MGDWYDTTNGATEGGFKARPVVGGHLALVRTTMFRNIAEED